MELLQREGGGGAPLTLSEPGPWGVIWGVGGLCWLVVTGTALLWMLPTSGTTMNGMYIITSRARSVQHLLVFVAAAFVYRLAIALGWPGTVWARARVAVANTLLALGVVAWAPLATALAAGYVDGHTRDMYDTLDAWLPPPLHAESWATPLRFFLPPYVLGLCAIALVLMARRHHREVVRAADLASAYAAARMAMLSAQLQPHFLFNSLHAISVLIDDSPRQAATMLARLGDFLRHALESSHWPWVDVATELTGLEAYLAVQQTRFSDRLSISIDASSESLGMYLPSLLLQPLAENAIEHGRRDAGPALRVRVAASVVAERLCIVVNNSSPQLPRDLAPQLMLLDIRMPELDGFELVAACAEQGLNPYIIFVSAYSDRSMDAFGVGAIDYLLKPFDDERFARALARAKSLIAAAQEPGAAAAAPPPSLAAGRTRLLLSERGKVVVLAMRDIEFVQAAAKYVKIYAGGRCFSLRQSLGSLEGRLDPALFVRVHRSTLVNVEHIAEMHPLFHGDYELILRRGTRLTLSRRYRERLAPFLLG